MRRLALLLVSVAVAASRSSATTAQESSWLEPYREPAARLIAESTANTFAWNRLAVLTDSIGHRLSGSGRSIAPCNGR
jgi:hypothetical protein